MHIHIDDSINKLLIVFSSNEVHKAPSPAGQSSSSMIPACLVFHMLTIF